MIMRGTLTLLLLTSCAHSVQEQPHPHFVDLTKLDDSVVIDMRYAGDNNFVGELIKGHSRPRCLLTDPAARALAGVQQQLRTRGISLVIYDSYRPQRDVDRFVRLADDWSDTRSKPQHYPNIKKSQLFEFGYIAERSSHTRGSTVDVALIKRVASEGWTLINMGTDYDLFDPSSPIESEAANADQQQNRRLLRDAMEAGGFDNFLKEWWHYTLHKEPYPNDYWDVMIR